MHPSSALRCAFAVFFLICGVFSAFGLGGKEDPLAYSDVLIKARKYDEAILYLSDFLKQYPERFDEAQAKLRKITLLRGDWNKNASDLLEVLKNDPLNNEKKIALIRVLDDLGGVDKSPAIKDFIQQTLETALFTYNNAQLKQIMDQGRLEIDGNKFGAAAKSYISGFELYKPEFLKTGGDELTIRAVTRTVDETAATGNQLSQAETSLLNAFQALAAAFTKGDETSIDTAFEPAATRARELFATRTTVVKAGLSLERQFTAMQAVNKTLTDSSFLPFAYRFILGRTTEPKLEGIAGAMDALWTYALDLAQNAWEKDSAARLPLAMDAFVKGTQAGYTEAAGQFRRVAALAERAERLLGLWALPAGSDLVERSTNFGLTTLNTKGKDWVRVSHLRETASAWMEASLVMADISSKDAALASYVPPPSADKTAVLAAFGAFEQVFSSGRKTLESLAAASATRAVRIVSLGTDGYAAESSLSAQGRLDESLSTSLSKAGVFEVKAVARTAGYEYGLFDRDALARMNEVDAARGYLDGVPSDDPLLPDALFKYPSRALSTLTAAETALRTNSTDIGSFLRKNAGKPEFVKNDASVGIWSDNGTALVARIAAKLVEVRELSARATEQRRLAESARLEAEKRLAEANSAFLRLAFESARERLDRCRERYIVSLGYEEDKALRTGTDKAIADLSRQIFDAENAFVIKETARLLGAGKTSYYAGDFDIAQSSLLQARDRWKTTHPSSPEKEVEQWLKLVQNALLVKTGSTIPMTAPLYPEMSRLLSLARSNYENGKKLMARKDKVGALNAFKLAQEKILALKTVYPLHQEAGILELQILFETDKAEFDRTYARYFSEAKTNIDAKLDVSVAYARLLNLRALNPRYSGLTAVISQAEILLGLRLPPPDPVATARSNELLAQAQRIYDLGDRALFQIGVDQLIAALELNPQNAQASALKEKMIGFTDTPSTSIPIDAQQVLNSIITFIGNGDYLNARARLTPLFTRYPQLARVQRFIDVDKRLTDKGY